MTQESKDFLTNLSVEMADREDVLTAISEMLLREDAEEKRLINEANTWKRNYTERFLSEPSKEPVNPTIAPTEETPVDTIDDIFARAEMEE